MGFELARFVNRQISKEFICTICRDVLKDPVMFSSCEHIFCQSCIDEWLTDNDCCPVDRNQVFVSDQRAPFRAFRNLYGELELTCDFAEQGCHAVAKIENLDIHLLNCEFNPEAQIDCSSQCGAKFPRNKIEEHNCVDYLKNLLDENVDAMQDVIKQNDVLKDRIEKLSKKAADVIEEARAAVNSPLILKSFNLNDSEVSVLIKISITAINVATEFGQLAAKIQEGTDLRLGKSWNCIVSTEFGSQVYRSKYIDIKFGNLKIVVWKFCN